MTNQEAFNKVCDHLMQQNAKAVHPSYENDRCAYRDTEHNRKCAVGCLIPDNEYDINMEGHAISSLLNSFSVPLLRAVYIDLLLQLQDVHDARLVSQWPESLNEIT